MARLALLASLIPVVAAQINCDMTGPLEENKFISAFRRSYFDIFSDNQGHNLYREAERIYSNTRLNHIPNEGRNCEERQEITKRNCDACVRRMGWAAPEGWFGSRTSQRVFTQNLRERGCKLKECTRSRPSPAPSSSPEPGALVFKRVSDDSVSDIVRFRMALVAETGWSSIFYSVEDLSGRSGGFTSAIIYVLPETRDVGFFSCARGLLEEPGLASRAGSVIFDDCYNNDFGMDCVTRAIGIPICEALRDSGCVANGVVMASMC